MICVSLLVVCMYLFSLITVLGILSLRKHAKILVIFSFSKVPMHVSRVLNAVSHVINVKCNSTLLY